MKNKIKLLLPIFLSTTISSCNTLPSYEVYFASYKTAEKVSQKIFFEDSYFDKAASQYNPSLATCSAQLALAGFAATTTKNYSTADSNAKYFFDTLGFESYYANDYGKKVPTAHSFGVFVAQKKIKDYTLLGVTVRGAGYLSEWASNVTLGADGEFAVGFKEASDIYLDTVKTYIENNSITGKIKLWTAGYSRGGAGVNLSVGRLDTALINNEKLLGNSLEYTKEDLYAYCFEPPAGKVVEILDGKIVEQGEDYSNIHCLVNKNDPVPFVAPIEFGFGRYGIDHYLPDLTTSNTYKEHIEIVQENLRSLSNYSVIGDYQIDKFVTKGFSKGLKKHQFTQGKFLDTFITSLAYGIGGRQAYSENFEGAIGSLFQFIYRNGAPKDSLFDLAIALGKNLILLDTEEVILRDLQHNPSYLWKDLKPLLVRALKNQNIQGLELDKLIETLHSLVNALITMLKGEDYLLIFPTLFHLDNIKCLGFAHIPELLLSHMKALDKNHNNAVKASVSDTSYILEIEGVQNFELYYQNKVVVESNIKEVKTSYSLENNETFCRIFLPKDKGYRLVSNEDLKVNLYENKGSYYTPEEVTYDDSILKGEFL